MKVPALLAMTLLGAGVARGEDGAAKPEGYQYFLGGGGSIPDGVPFELLMKADHSNVGMRFFLAPPVTVKFTRIAPPENENFENQVEVATPQTPVPVTLRYGPIVGVELLRFLEDSPIFLAAGLSVYQAAADAAISTPLLLCFSGQACTPGTADAKTTTNLHAHAHATVAGVRARSSVGWLEQLGSSFYISAVGGISAIVLQQRQVETDASMDNDPALTDLANAEIQAGLPNKENVIANRANSEIDKFDQRWLPILTLTAGIRF